MFWSHFWQGEQCKDISKKCNFSFPHCRLYIVSCLFWRFDQASSKKHYTAFHNVCSLWWSVRPEVRPQCKLQSRHHSFLWTMQVVPDQEVGECQQTPQSTKGPVSRGHHSLRAFQAFQAFQVRNPQLRYTSRTDPWKRPHRATRPPSRESCGLRLWSLVTSLKQDVERSADVALMYIYRIIQNLHCRTGFPLMVTLSLRPKQMFSPAHDLGEGHHFSATPVKGLFEAVLAPASFKSMQCFLSFHDSCHIALEVRRRTELHTLGTAMSAS